MKSTASEIVKVKKKVRLQEWEQQIEEQKTSGLSVQEWCRQNGIAAKTYYYHLRKTCSSPDTDRACSRKYHH